MGGLFLEPPFERAPSRRYEFRTGALSRALDSVTEDLRRDVSCIVVSGSDGVGKTTFCRMLPGEIQWGPLVLVCENASAAADELLAQLPPDFTGQVVFVIDDAEQLPDAVRDELLELCVSVGPEGERLQLVLTGGPDLRVRLPGATPVRHRELMPIDDEEVGAYIRRRLWVARGGLSGLGAGPAATFSGGAVRLIAGATHGNPAAINAACKRVLELAEARTIERIPRWLVHKALTELGLVQERRSLWRPSARVAAIVLSILAVGSAVTGLTGSLIGRPSAPSRGVPAAAASIQEFKVALRERASELAGRPDVKGLLKLQQEVQQWDLGTGYSNTHEVEKLQSELRQLLNTARERQLSIDRELLARGTARR
jgi:type II secretory pathway predicted ATPase ExeA